MRIEKENEFTSFSKILNKIDAGSLGEQEIRMIKQEHSYLEKLRQQRIKVNDNQCRLRNWKGNMMRLKAIATSSQRKIKDFMVILFVTQK